MTFDLRTLSVAAMVCALGFTASMWLLRRLLPDDRSLPHWAHGAMALLAGIVLQGMRTVAPEILTLVAGNTLIAVGGAFIWSGAMALAERPLSRKVVQGIAVVNLAGNLVLLLLWDSAQWRMVLLSASLAVCFAGAAWGFWWVGQQRLRGPAWATTGIFGVGALLFALRVLLGNVGHTTTPTGMQAWEFVLPYVFAIMFLNWVTVIVAVVVGQKLRQHLIQALRQAEESDRAKSAFLASITHEWRTPLNAISGFSQLLTNDHQIPHDVRQSAALIHTAGNQLLDVVNDLMDLRALQDASMEFKFRLCHAQPLIDQALEDWRLLAGQHGVTLMAQGAATNPTIWVDPDRFKQVIGHLLSNAIKFNTSPGVARVHWFDEGESITLTVSDDGPGIPPHLHHRVFTPFDRLGAESGDVPGTGVGLAISQQLVQRMGGTTGFSSPEGKGCTFWIRFPMAMAIEGELVMQAGVSLPPAGHPDYPATQPTTQQAPAIPQGKRVLYVEDNLTNQKLVQAVFQKQLGIEVTVAVTEEEGIALAQQLQPHLILMDLNLPGMDGYSALKVLRTDSRTGHIPVMAVTAQSRPEDLEQGRQAGFDAYLTKPLKLGNLISQAMQLLKR